MDQSQYKIKQALEDLAVIKRALVSSDTPGEEKSHRSALIATRLLHLMAFSLALAILGHELVFDHQNTQLILASAHSAALRLTGIASIAFILIMLIATLYFVVYRSSKTGEKDFNRYVARNFKYLHNLSFCSDLLVKYCVFALIILAQKPEWLSTVFMLFVADYYIQGRFFNLSIRQSYILGSLSLVAAGYMWMAGVTTIMWPTSAFAIGTLLSITNTNRLIEQALEE